MPPPGGCGKKSFFIEVPPQALKRLTSVSMLYGTLKRPSSTELHAFVSFSEPPLGVIQFVIQSVPDCSVADDVEDFSNSRCTVQKAILIADDNAGVRRAVRNALEKSGEWKICGEAVNGRDVIEKAEQLHPDLVVVDFSMPVMNGLEAARALKRWRPSMPVVLFTIFKDRFLEAEAFAAGISVVVAKEDGIGVLAEQANVLLKYAAPDYTH